MLTSSLGRKKHTPPLWVNMVKPSLFSKKRKEVMPSLKISTSNSFDSS